MSTSTDTTFSDPGETPTIKWVELNAFVVDHHYQRKPTSERSRNLIDHITHNFRWAAFQPIIVTPTSKGDKYIIIDGQHRVHAVRGRTDIKKIPCYIVPHLTPKEQATNFVAINSNRLALTPLHMHHAKAACGDKSELLVQRVCQKAGVVISRSQLLNYQMPAGHTQAVSAIKRCIKGTSEECVIEALKSLNYAFKKTPGILEGRVIEAVVGFYKDMGLKDINNEALQYTLKEKDMEGFKEWATKQSRERGLSVVHHMTRDIKRRYADYASNGLPHNRKRVYD